MLEPIRIFKFDIFSFFLALFSDRFLQSDRKNLSKRKKICTNSNIRIGSWKTK
ncbi:hypothetical protein wcw_1045 [Waddlia chondrophila WSU 86-1044]|uniref:Uncharacterized protein n=1 Tax=Waddlia chondrophila (strain ATCC VR-1470 / WSU 86-1044) TaxID=716544 RepID=D6YW93_WADCW|nr:hypothetical protein wcw_1045 [Waddlia chondrophila WSU 86-1044]